MSISDQLDDTNQIDILQLRQMLLDKGFSVSHSSLSHYVKLGKIPGFNKLSMDEYKGLRWSKDKWYISIEDAKIFIKSFDYFGVKNGGKNGK